MNTRTQPGPASSRFVAPSVREALRLVREQLGSDAIILSNRVTSQGVEIVASTADATPVPPRRVPAQRRSATGGAAAGESTAPARRASDAEADAISSKVDAMRSLIDEQLAERAWTQAKKREPLRGHLLRMLLGAGFSARLAKDLLAKLPQGQSLASGIEYVKSMLALQLPMIESEETLMRDGGVYALMGPTGVGKTTTTAKLAARCVMRFGSAKLALVTTDSYRIGAYEQLRIYGQILGVSVHAVKDAADLELVLANLRDKHMVLIDTVGMSQRDRAVSDQVAMLCGASRPVKRLLLLNASSHGDTLNEVVHAYRHGEHGDAGNELAGCIFTKVDEATHPGVMLDMAIRYQLPVHYVSNGQKVPEDLQLGDRGALIDSVFQPRSRRSLFVAAEADLEQAQQPVPPAVVQAVPVPVSAPASPPASVPASAALPVAAASAAPVPQSRPQSQCQQLIEVLTHDAQEITTTTNALAGAHIGFNEIRALWPQFCDEQVAPGQIAQALAAQAGADSFVSCSDHVLCVARELAVPTRAAVSAELIGTLVLSDRTGLPFAAPNPMLAGAAPAGLAQLGWVQPPSFAKPVVHLLGALPSTELMLQWQASGILWAASCTAQTLQQFGKTATSLFFSKPVPTLYRNKPAWLSVALMPLRLRPELQPGVALTAAASLKLRCAVRRIVDVESGEPLAHDYVLASGATGASAQQMAQWPGWRDATEPYFKLLAQSIAQLALEAPATALAGGKRMLLSGQVANTVFLLQRKDDAWAQAAQQVLAQLSGRFFAPDQPVPASVLLEGLGKLLVLLDTSDGDDAAAQSARAVAVAQN